MVEYKIVQDHTLDKTLRALADPTRRHILNQLTSGEKRVTEIAAPLDMSLNSVSKHIKKLESCGLVKRRKQGREHFLMAVPEQLDETAEWFFIQRARWNKCLNTLEKLLEGDSNE